jgi:hypothetical protein
MIIQEPENARYLPVGDLVLKGGGEVMVVSIDESYVCAAAKFLIDRGLCLDVSTQAEIVARAVNQFQWGLGANNYVAIDATYLAR